METTQAVKTAERKRQMSNSSIANLFSFLFHGIAFLLFPHFTLVHQNILHFSPSFRTIQDPASQRLTWYKAPMAVLVIKKVRDASVIPPFIQLVFPANYELK